ncbi:hypothetical protein EPD62_004930 [Acetivibrio thermocellus]|uniref:hypothetical protein n=1 Tax=Acetivibrio thermocellus TaxID=1515 RepID=UPI0010A678CF|nr:hypothetical protein [Acetivibrio thermocellus]THJ77870.1 hypothetical protein EPD62_09000 [Acetivibrio thermocellus]
MAKNSFIRFAETLMIKKEMRVVSITVRLMITDCTGTIYFTDLQLQDGDQLTGYTVHTSKMLTKMQENGQPVPPRHYNGVVRTAETVILFNLGKTSAGLDCYIYPIQDMAAGSIEISQDMGAHKVRFLDSVNAGDELALKASTRQCIKNGSPTRKDGFYQYSAAWDSKHMVKLEERKSARVLFEFQEMQEGGDRL